MREKVIRDCSSPATLGTHGDANCKFNTRALLFQAQLTHRTAYLQAPYLGHHRAITERRNDVFGYTVVLAFYYNASLVELGSLPLYQDVDCNVQTPPFLRNKTSQIGRHESKVEW